MRNSTAIVTSSSYVALVFGGVLMSTGCETGIREYADSVTLEVRFQDDDAATQDTVARILVDVGPSDDSQPLLADLELTKLAPDVWRGNVPFLPRNQRLRFAARALDASGDIAFSGEALATLTMDHQVLQIPLAPVTNHPPGQVPEILRIVYPTEIFSGQEAQFVFTLRGNTGAAIAVQITRAGSTTPAAEFSPATGTVTLTSTVADFMTVYTAPSVTVDTTFDYQVTVTDARAQGAVAATTEFTTTVKPRPPGPDLVTHIHPSVRFNPVILGLTANGSEIPGIVELVATVSDDSAPDQLVYQWSYTPSTGTPDATFASSGQGNPGLLQGYTVDHEGIISLAVTDEHGGTTTVHYQLARDQFADPIDHTSAQASTDGLKRIVAGGSTATSATATRGAGRSRSGQMP